MIEFISSAMAQEAAATVAKQPSAWSSLMPLVLIMVVFYFLLIRPQQKKAREHQEMIGAVKKGDKIVTAGGILGAIVKVDSNDGVATVEIADGVKIKVKQETIATVINPTPAAKTA